MIHFAPRALVVRPLIRLEVTPFEHAGLIAWRRIAELREAAR
jgi:hypothetical protein